MATYRLSSPLIVSLSSPFSLLRCSERLSLYAILQQVHGRAELGLLTLMQYKVPCCKSIMHDHLKIILKWSLDISKNENILQEY